MAADIHVVVTCTDRKGLPVPDHLRLGSIQFGDTRFDEWRRRLENAERIVPALDLYAGEAWQIVRDLPAAVATGSKIRRWVVSAGYGFLETSTLISPYGAAFSLRTADSVARGSASTARNSDWWAQLTQWQLPDSDSPRSLAALADRYPDGIIVLACSEVYLRAIREDVERVGRGREGFFVISPSGRCDAGHRIPCDARLQSTLGGSRISMNNRALRFLLDSAELHDFDAGRIDEVFDATLSEGTIVTHSREPMSDDDVRSFVRRQLTDSSEPPTSRTAALRVLRDSGMACEQKRFGQLWSETASQLAASP